MALWPDTNSEASASHDSHHNHSLSWLFETVVEVEVDNVTRSEHGLRAKPTANQSEIRKDPEVPTGHICTVILGNVRVAGYDPTLTISVPANGYSRLSRWLKVIIFVFSLSLYTFSLFPRVYKPGKVPISVLSLGHAINGEILRLLSSSKAVRLAKRSSSLSKSMMVPKSARILMPSLLASSAIPGK